MNQRETFERIRAAYVEFDRDWNFAYVNVWAAELFGCGQQDLIGLNLWQGFPQLAGTMADREFHLVAEKGVDSRFSYLCPIVQRWVEIQVLPIESGFAIYLRDISKHHAAEEEVTRLNRDLTGRVNELQTLLEVVPVGIAISGDPQCLDIRTNSVCAEMLGVGRDENISKSRPDSDKLPFRIQREGRELSPDELPLQFAAAHNTQVREFEVEIVRNDGRVLNLLQYASPIQDEEGGVRGCVGVFIDITEMKRSQQQLQAIYQLASSVAHSENLNDVYAATLDAAESVFTTKRCAILLADDDGVQRFAAWRGVSDRHRETVETNERWRKTETIRQVLIENVENADMGPAKNIILGEGVRAIGLVPLVAERRIIGKLAVYFNEPHIFTAAERALLHTIAYHAAYGIERQIAETHRLQLLERERQARSEAERANRLKDEFLAVVSHEIRTPLGSITGWCHLLKGGQLDEHGVARALDTITRNAQSQAQLIEDILDVSRIIAGKLQLEKTPVQLPAVIQAALESVRPAAERKRIQLQLRFTAYDLTTLGDSGRLQQVMLNILSNAVKFSLEGSLVDIALGKDGSEGRIIVTDTGQGIAAEFLPHVFERFRQADGSTTRKHGGLGLGLSIAKDILALHGGSISVVSDGPGLGTQVMVRLPLVTSESTSADKGAGLVAPSSAKKLRGIRALAVDDHQETLDLMGLLLENEGAVVQRCNSAAEAVLALDNFEPDVLIADLAMPDEDGCTLLKRLRTERHMTMPAIAVTACLRDEDRERIREAGFAAQLPKPFDPDVLIHSLVRVCLAGK
jgi:PAS domain S-box-containing protein